MLRQTIKNLSQIHTEKTTYFRTRKIKEDTLGKIRYLTDTEEQRLYQAMDKREARIREKRIIANAWRQERGYALLEDLTLYLFVDHIKPMILLSINTGLRQG